jgi:hypothetical protein
METGFNYTNKKSGTCKTVLAEDCDNKIEQECADSQCHHEASDIALSHQLLLW